ncbi:PQQ-binding-like beta-propeller repeat protein [Streptomyces sp. NPDC048659]|uniref:WD40 repeat domain-containing protein n=1 Tax=Streptomyces sp. NPDC048659 TaxID=3155489 RepID=UPI003415965C
MPSVRAERPGAAALLGWLTDPEAPRLCLVTEAPGLLDWLAGQTPRAAGRRRTTRALVPLTGQSALGAAWAIASHLGVVAASPADLVHVLATTEPGRTPRTILLLPALHEAAEPTRIAELLRDLATQGRIRIVVETRETTPEQAILTASRATVIDAEQHEPPPSPPAQEEHLPDLSDPTAVVTADPYRVTAGYVREADDEHGGLRPAWLRAGQALCAAATPADRALALLTSLGDGADPRIAPALEEAARPAPWKVRWTRVTGDVTPPWPGPIAALAVQGGTVLAADRTGTVHLLNAADAHPRGRLVHPVRGRVTALAPTPDGTVLLLDERGRLHPVPGTAPRPPYLQRLTEAVAATLTRHPGTALAAIQGSVIVGDRLGSVHAFGLTGLHQAAPHSGRVTAVAAVESETPFVCSGGIDGTVRRWIPGEDPDPTPLAERPSPVVALHAAETPYGPFVAMAWADGTVQLHGPEGNRTFRPGPPVRAVAVTPDAALLIGMDESLTLLDRTTG